MPLFRDLRDTRGRFVSRQTANDLEAALEDAITNVNPAAWKRFALLTQQRLGGDPWDLIRRYGSQIPFNQAPQAGGGGAGRIPPPGPRAAVGGFQPDPWTKRTFEDINKHLKHLDEIETRRARDEFRIPPWPGRTGSLGMGPWGPRGSGGSVPSFPGSAGAGFGGGGGGRPPIIIVPPAGGGGARGGGGGSFGGGRATGGLLGQALRSVGFGLAELEIVRDVLNPVGALSRDLLDPLLNKARRSFDFRTNAFMLSRTSASTAGGGFSPETAIGQIFQSGMWPGNAIPLQWMQALGVGPEEVQQNLLNFGIRPRSAGEMSRNQMALTFAERGALPGLAGLPGGTMTGLARQFAGAGAFGGQELGRTTFFGDLSTSMQDAVERGMDRTRVLNAMEQSLEMLVKSGAPQIGFGSLLSFFQDMAKGTTVGAMTGQLAQQAIGGGIEAARTLGVDPTRTMMMLSLMSKFGFGTRRGAAALLGPELMRSLAPEQASVLESAIQAYARGQQVPAVQMLQDIFGTDVGARRLQELGPLGAQLMGLPSGAVSQQFILRQTGLPMMEQMRRGLGRGGGATEGIRRGGTAERLWQWARAHGYSDQAASAMVSTASWEGSLDPHKHNLDMANQLPDLGMFQMQGAELANFMSWAHANGKDPESMEAQAEWYDKRMGQINGPGFRQETNMFTAMGQTLGFERPSADQRRVFERVALAQRTLGVFGGTGVSPSAHIDTIPPEGILSSPSPDLAPGDIVPGTGQTFGNLRSGLPGFFPSIAVGRQAGLADSDVTARQFADNLGTAVTSTVEFVKSLNVAGDALDKFTSIVNKVQQDWKAFNTPGQTSSETHPAPVAH